MAGSEVALRSGVLASSLLLCAGCALDERVLHEGPSFQVDATTGSGGGSGSGGTSNGGASSSGSGGDASSSTNGSGGGSGDSANGTSVGGGASSSTSGSTVDCPDLDENGVADCEETLVGNPGFESDVAEWDAEHQVEVAWAGEGSNDDDDGAISVTNLGTASGGHLSMAGGYQCIPVQEHETYLIYAQTFIPDGQDSGLAALSLSFYDSNNCSGPALDVVTSPMLSTLDRWRLLSGDGTAPESANSLKVRLVAVKQQVYESFEVRFDNVLVRRE